MSFARHQWNWDFRRIRVAWVLWIALLSLSAVLRFHVLTDYNPRSPLVVFSGFLTAGVVYLAGGLWAAWILSTTPFTGSSAHWRSLPLSQATLFREKSLFIGLLIALPALASLILPLALFVPETTFVLRTTLIPSLALLAILLLASLWAALSSRVSTFIGYLTGSLALCAGAAIAANQWRIHFGPLGMKFVTEPFFGTAQLFLLTLVFLVVILTTAWLLLAWRNRRRSALGLGAAALIILPGVNVLWSILPKPIARDSQGIDLIVREQNEVLPANQVPLFPQLSVELPDDQALWMTSLNASLQLQGGNISRAYFHSSTQNDHLLNQLQRFFPDSAKVLGTSAHQGQRLRLDLPSYGLGEKPTFYGRHKSMLHKIHLLGSLTIKNDVQATLSGAGRARVSGISEDHANLSFDLTTLLTRFRNQYNQSHGDYTLYLVVHEPKSNTLFLPKSKTSSGSGINSFTGLRGTTATYHLSKNALAEALGAEPTLADLSDLKLTVFSLRPIKYVSGSFHRANWMPFEEHRQDRDLPVPDWTKATLPEHPTTAQVEHYLDQLLYGLPDDLQGDQWRTAAVKLEALAPAHLPELIARLPLQRPAHDLAYRVILKHANQSHLPVLLAALEDNPSLAGTLLRKGWQKQAAPILARRLHQHSPISNVTASVVLVVATMQDPATYPDLAWHFLHTESGHLTMTQALAKCPDFPLEETIRQAWALARTGVSGTSTHDLMFLAAAQGDHDAFRISLSALLTQSDKNRLAVFDQLVAQPEGADPLRWTLEHFEDLRYDPENQRFALAP